MGFSKFSICDPCCGQCIVNYNSYVCTPSVPLSDQSFPPYLDIQPSDVMVYVAKCTGIVSSFDSPCESCFGYTSPVTEIFYPFLNPISESGKHTFRYTAEKDAIYTVVTRSNRNNIFRATPLLIDDTFSCLPICSGNIFQQLIPTGWFGGLPCWWSNDYASKPLSFIYDGNVIKEAIDQVHMVQEYCCVNSLIFNPIICWGDISNPPISCSPIGSYTKVIYNPGFFTFTSDTFRSVSILPTLFSWVSDIKLQFVYINFTPSGTSCDGPTSTQDVATVSYQYICTELINATCQRTATAILLASSFSPGVLPNDGNGSFVGTDALSQAEAFASLLPRTIPATGTLTLNTESLYSFGTEIGPYSFSCPGLLNLTKTITSSSCGLPPISGVENLTVIQ